MSLDAAKVLIGTADQQSATGAIRNGAAIERANIPTTFQAAETLLGTLNDAGYVSEDGVELGNDLSTNDIREWNHAIVRKVLDSFDNTLSWSYIQFDADSWKQALGEAYVTETAATTTHGAQMHIKMGAHLAPVMTWGFAMKDGDTRVIIIVPRGQVTTLDSITFNATDAVALPITLSCYDDGTANTVHIYVDDGKTTS